MASFSDKPSTTVDQGGGAATFSSIHPDIFNTHILTRLDGPTLVAATCASSELHALCSDHNLWRDICAATWPSTDDPRIRQLISTFPSGHRSFFSDSFPLLDHHHHSSADRSSRPPPPPTLGLISAVDIFYRDELIFSRVQENETETGWFMSSPFRVELFDQNETVPIPILHGGDEDDWLGHLEESLTLNWIVIDPTRKRAANISSRRPISVQRHWLTGDVQVRYGTIMAAGKSELVQCRVVVTCGGKEGGELQVSEMSMEVEGMDGRILNGKDSLVIIQEAIENGKRMRGNGQDGKKSFEEFEEMKVRKRKRMQRIEKALDWACIATGLTTFIMFWAFIFFR